MKYPFTFILKGLTGVAVDNSSETKINAFTHIDLLHQKS